MIAGGTDSSCAYCGLPLPHPWWRRGGEQSSPSGPRYCCYGCALAQQASAGLAPGGEFRGVYMRLGLAIFLTMNVMVFSMELWTQDVYSAQPDATSALSGPLRDVFRYLCLLLSLPVAWLLGRAIAASAWQNLRQGGPLTDVLILLGVAAAMTSSAIAVFRGQGPVYLEVACIVLVMMTIGRLLDANGKVQATAALEALEKMLPAKVSVIGDDQECSVEPQLVPVGERVRVSAGERFAFDGTLIAGQSTIDEQLLSGESVPISKGPGDRVYAGTMNLDGSVLQRVDAPLRAGALERIAKLMRDARQAKGYYQRLADRVATWFLPAVALIAIGAFGYHASRSGFDHGVMAGLAVALIACPCALGLASPMAIWAALGKASEAQVLIRGGEVLERLAAVRAVAIDKTGTLTSGSPRVDRFTAADAHAADAILRLAASVATGSSHPLAKAICRHAAGSANELPPHDGALNIRTVPGRGVIAEQPDEASLYLGSESWLQSLGLEAGPRIAQAIAQAHADGQSITCVGWDGEVRGAFTFAETLRADAATALARCRQKGLHVMVLTGDNRARGRALAESLGVDVSADLLPADKVAAVRQLQKEWGPAAVVGDGINDAPALTAGDVGMAMGCGADISRDAAGICLLSDQLERISWTISLARKTVNVVRLNLFWAFFYNSIGIVAACAGWLNPVWAAAAMLVSSLLVIGNSLRLRSIVIEPREPEHDIGALPVAQAVPASSTKNVHSRWQGAESLSQEQPA